MNSRRQMIVIVMLGGWLTAVPVGATALGGDRPAAVAAIVSSAELEARLTDRVAEGRFGPTFFTLARQYRDGLASTDNGVKRLQSFWTARAKTHGAQPEVLTEVGMALVYGIPRTWLPTRKLGLAHEAEGYFNRALAADPNNWYARFTRAMFYLKVPKWAGKLPLALRDFDAAVALQRASAPVEPYAFGYLYAGDAYQAADQPDHARLLWQEGARLFPTQPDLRARLADQQAR